MEARYQIPHVKKSIKDLGRKISKNVLIFTVNEDHL